MEEQYVRLLEIAPTFGAGLSGKQLAEARRLAVAPVVTLPAGHWEGRELTVRLGDAEWFGCIVAEGLIAHDLALDGRRATHLLGRGDLLAPAIWPCRQLPAIRVYGVADPTRVALLDHSFLPIAHRWPTIAGALLVQAERQSERFAVQDLIGHLPRADQRIVALLWHLADRWGRANADGMIVPLTMNHEAISHLIGGRRSTVSVALASLAERKLVTRLANDTWWIATDSRALLDGSPPPTPTPDIHLLGTPRRTNRRFDRTGTISTSAVRESSHG